MIRKAVISDDGVYRYSLTRRWAEGAPMVFVMLNPSTADADIDDPTIRRCIGFARRDNFPAIEVVNLYAYRATNPKELMAGHRIIAADNADYIRGAFYFGGAIVAAWGDWCRVNGSSRQADNVVDLVRREGLNLLCLGKTKHGSPRHPLYVKSDTAFEAYP